VSHARSVGPVLRVVAVIAGADDEDVAMLDLEAGVLLPTLEVFGPIHVKVADAESLQVDHARGPDQEIEWQVADELAARHEMRRCVQVRADVERHRDLLTAGAVEREVLDPANRGAGVTGKRRRVEREVLREVEEPHDARDVNTERCTFPIALRGRLSTLTTRLGHL